MGRQNWCHKPDNFGTRLHGGFGWSPKEKNESKYRLGDGIASVETGNVLKTRLIVTHESMITSLHTIVDESR